MTKYLLDTTVVSDFARGDAAVRSRLLAVPPSAIAVSTITVMEVEYGLALAPGRARKLRPVLTALLDSVEQVPYTADDARASAAVRAELRKRGRPIGPYDLLIAGTALSRGRVLVTSNVKELSHVKALDLEDWRA
jgi:tRNA(fMet)-specific endonuclease VapC